MRLPLDYDAARRLAHARRVPQLAFTAFDFAEVLEELRCTLLPSLDHRIESWFVREGPLACICHDDTRAVIFIHGILNHHKTPKGVFKLIAVHELLHLVIPPRLIGSKIVSHPPEFFEHEAALVPERDEAWIWMRTYFHDALRLDPEREGIMVRSNWRRVWRHLNRTGGPGLPRHFRSPIVAFM